MTRKLVVLVAFALAVTVRLCMGIAPATDAAIADATYAKLFDRARGLVPGETKVELDVTRTGELEMTGASRHGDDDKFIIEVKSEGFGLAWKIRDDGFNCEFPLRLQFRVETDIPLRIVPHVFTSDRFNRLEDVKTVDPENKKSQSLTFNLPPRYFGGFRLIFEGLDGKSLAGNTFEIKNMKLRGEYMAGYFRREVEIPDGEIWEAVAEVGNTTTLYINGQRVDDESIVRPRPVPGGPIMYQSRRTPIKDYLQPGRNVLGLQFSRANPGHRTTAYLRGSVIMTSGERIVLDSGADWVWNNEAPSGWATTDYEANDWKEIKELSWEEWRKERSAARLISVIDSILSMRPRGDMPCYDGFIKLRNPSDKKFFFNENTPFRLDAHIPSGFQDDNPELAWEISRYEVDGSFNEVARGNVNNFKATKDSLTGIIKTENITSGIYVFTGRLSANGKIIEEREPEPMVVVGKVAMEKSAGDSWEEGLNLSLEKIIDFTDPDDPHPWLEIDARGPRPGSRAIGSWGEQFYHAQEEPVIVERNGLKYRETRPVSWAQFSYHVEFANPGDWYLLVMEYPDDAERWIGVSCNADSRTPEPPSRHQPETLWTPCSKAGPAIWTGGKYPSSGKMLEMKWLYRPDPGPHAINVMSLMHDSAAAAARLRVYHVHGRLSELDTGDISVRDQRRFGMLTERTFPWANGIYNTFSSFSRDEIPNPRCDVGAGDLDDNAIRDGCAHLRLLKDAASHYAEYMRFSGQNLHVMGCWQYNDANTVSQYLTGDPRIHDSSENMLARVLQANDLMFYALVEFTSASRRWDEGYRSIQNPDFYFADRTGAKPTVQSRGFTPGMNFMHPAIEGDMLEAARQLAEKFKYQENFLGINWFSLFGVRGGAFLPSYSARGVDAKALDLGYDDFTIGLFEKETGIKVSVGAGQDNREPGTVNREPAIYEQRYQFLTSPEMKPVWAAWRARKLADFFTKATRVVQSVRPDLENVAGIYFMFGDIYADWQNRGVAFQKYLTEWGWNPAEFTDRDGVWLMPWLNAATRYRSGHHFTANHALEWQWFQEPEFYRQFAGLDRRALMFYIGWIEVQAVAANYPYRENWPRPLMQRLMGQQREEMAMEPYTQGMIGMDPQMVVMGFTDGVPYIGVEGMQRKFTRVLRRLPQDRFEPILNTGFDSNLAIRALNRDDDYLFYVANPGYWPINGRIELTGAGRVRDMVSGADVPLADGLMPLELDPFGIAVFQAHPTVDVGDGMAMHKQEIRITGWSTDPLNPSDLGHMQGILDRMRLESERPGLESFLGSGDYEVLLNAVKNAESALAKGDYARAWATLTDGTIWTLAFQKAPEIQYVGRLDAREIVAHGFETSMAPKIDGFLNDAVWQSEHTKAVTGFVGKDKEYAPSQTFVRVAHVNNRLFIAFEMLDSEPENIRGVADASDQSRSIWSYLDDLVALFIKPPEGDAYYQFAVTANGTTFSQHNSPRGRDYAYAPEWEAATGRSDTGWTIEVEIDTLDAFGVPIREGDEWRINFHRQFRFNEQPHSSWTYSDKWHDMNQTGELKFIERNDMVN